MADEFTVPPKTKEHLKKLNDLFKLINPKWNKPRMEYLIRVDGEEVWSGLDLPTKYLEILDKHPADHISIGWRSYSRAQRV